MFPFAINYHDILDVPWLSSKLNLLNNKILILLLLLIPFSNMLIHELQTIQKIQIQF